jgi:hypothetical protein
MYIITTFKVAESRDQIAEPLLAIFSTQVSIEAA